MDIVMDEVTAGVLAELEKTQKYFWNVPKGGLIGERRIDYVKHRNRKRIHTSVLW